MSNNSIIRKIWLTDHKGARLAPNTTIDQVTMANGAPFASQWEAEKRLTPYCTPERFGAIGDGFTDDTLAIQKAISSGLPVILSRKYLITEPLIFYNDVTFISFGELLFNIQEPYSIIMNGNNSLLYINKITSNQGGITTGSIEMICYNEIYIDFIETQFDTFYFKTKELQKINNNSIYCHNCLASHNFLFCDNSIGTFEYFNLEANNVKCINELLHCQNIEYVNIAINQSSLNTNILLSNTVYSNISIKEYNNYTMSLQGNLKHTNLIMNKCSLRAIQNQVTNSKNEPCILQGTICNNQGQNIGYKAVLYNQKYSIFSENNKIQKEIFAPIDLNQGDYHLNYQYFKIKPTDNDIVHNSILKLSPSYCADNLNRIIIDQTESANSTVTVYDYNDNKIFNGEQMAQGRFLLECFQEENTEKEFWIISNF